MLFTPILAPQYLHMVAAAYMTAGFLVASVYAVGWLRGRRDRYHRLGFLVPFTVAAIVTPAQFMIGDSLARTVYQEQPVKFAAIEIVWKTGPDQPEYLYGRLQPDGTVDGGITIPGLDSFLAGFSRDTVVQGLTEVPADQRPTIRQANITHFAFDTMVGVGTVLMGLALWFGVAWVRRRDIPALAGSTDAQAWPGWPRSSASRPAGSPPRSGDSRGSSTSRCGWPRRSRTSAPDPSGPPSRWSS